MSDVEVKARRGAIGESSAVVVWAPEPAARDTPSRRPRIIPVLITLAVIAVAIVLGRVTARCAPMS